MMDKITDGNGIIDGMADSMDSMMIETQSILNNIWPGWKIKGVLGEGSFGTVYHIVRKDRLGHDFSSAMKRISIPKDEKEVQEVIREGLDEKSATSYFRSMVEDVVDEIVLMSRLKGNSNIVSYEDHAIIKREENIGWDIFIRMELLTTLYDYMKEHPFLVKDVLKMGIDLCRALELCQKDHIIHRDIKPENIFVSDIGNFKLGDFGIARTLEKNTSGLSMKGTYSYIAPEVYRGENYGAAVDIYSLGMVLYRFLNDNRGPFMPPYPEPIKYSDREQANVYRLLGTPFPFPANAGDDLGKIVLKACEYDPAKRYQTASQFRIELERVLRRMNEDSAENPDNNALHTELLTDFSPLVPDEAPDPVRNLIINMSSGPSIPETRSIPEPEPAPEPASKNPFFSRPGANDLFSKPGDIKDNLSKAPENVYTDEHTEAMGYGEETMSYGDGASGYSDGVSDYGYGAVAYRDDYSEDHTVAMGYGDRTSDYRDVYGEDHTVAMGYGDRTSDYRDVYGDEHTVAMGYGDAYSDDNTGSLWGDSGYNSDWNPDNNRKKKTAVIVGGVIGIFLIILIVVLLFLFVF